MTGSIGHGQPPRDLLNWGYVGTLTSGVGRIYWWGRGSGNGYVATANTMGVGNGGVIRELRSWASVTTAQAAKNLTTYISLTGTPAVSNSPTHTVALSMASTGWVMGADQSVATFQPSGQIWVQTDFDAGTYIIDQLGVTVSWESASGELWDILTFWEGQLTHNQGTLRILGTRAANKGCPLSQVHRTEVKALHLAYLPTLPAGGSSGVILRAFKNDPTGAAFLTCSDAVNSLAWRQQYDTTTPTIFEPGDELFVTLEAVRDGGLPPPTDQWTANFVQMSVSTRVVH